MKHILLMFFSEARLHHDGMMMDGVRDKESVVQSIADSLKVQGEQLDCLCCFSTKKLPEEIGYGDEVSCAYILNHEALIQRGCSLLPDTSSASIMMNGVSWKNGFIRFSRWPTGLMPLSKNSRGSRRR